MSVVTGMDASARPGVEIRLLGAFSVTVSGVRVAPRAWRLAKAQHIVKLLALDSRHRLHRDELIDLLWPDREPRSAANNLYQALSAARRAITSAGGDGHDCLRLEDEWVTFAPAAGVWVDVEAFEALSCSNDAKDLRAALSLYGGELLADDRYAEWLMARRAALGRARNDLLQRLAQHCLDAGDLTEARRLLERVLDDDPADENAHQGLMRVHARSGNRAAAQQQFTALEFALRDNLDVEPAVESRRILDQIRGGKFAPVGPVAPRMAEHPQDRRDIPNNLPTALSSFVGRGRELTELPVAVTRHRLITLTGPGGCGKTRLATEVAARCLGEFLDGVLLVELGPLTSRSGVDLEIARTLGVRGAPRKSLVKAIADRIGTGRLLLLLDNCEHLIDASAAIAETLLSECPRLTVVATSREPLRVPGEWVRRVPSLRLPDVDDLPPPSGLIQYEAVRLLVDRVSVGDPDFELDASNAATAAQICVRLDGLPLAIELAAALVPALTLAAVAEALDDRFHLLTAGRRTGLTRHQTLEAAIGWSFDLLPDDQRYLLCRLATFRDSFDVSAAVAVGIAADTSPAAVAARLADLVDRSMIVAEPVMDQPRFRLLETIREYAVTELRDRGAIEEALDAHARWFASYVDRAVGELTGPEQHRWLARLDQSRTDLRAALARLRIIDPPEAVRLTAAMWTYWLWFGYLDDGIGELEAALAREDGPSEARSACWLGVFALNIRWKGIRSPGMHGYLDNAVAEARAVRAAGAESRALVFDGIHRMFSDLDPFDTASERFQRAEEIASSAGLVADQASALHARAVLAAHCSRLRLSHELLQETHRLLSSLPREAGAVLMLPACPITTSRRLGVPWLVWEDTLMPHLATAGRSAEAYVEANLGSLKRAVGQEGEARRHLERALTTYHDEGDEPGEALALARLGSLALAKGELERARCRMEEALAACESVGDVRGRHMVMLGLSRVAIEKGTPGIARRLLDDVQRAAREQGDQPAVWGALEVRGALEVAVGSFGAGITALREAREMAALMGHPLTIALVSLDLADALRRAGQLTDATEPARAAHTIFETLGYEQAEACCRRILTEADDRQRFSSR
ncbi:MAG: tetratricopeptide repeat protein [Intrasporangiaceae bacterium]|nr:tetratricopeptide repeat protein [Intrasporangiaceae bacterium]